MKQFLFSNRLVRLGVVISAFALLPAPVAMAATTSSGTSAGSGHHVSPDPMML
jgi:hypothetical protein